MLLVIGGTGTVGRYLMGELRAAGVTPRVLARTLRASEAAREMGGIPVAGSLDDRASLPRAFDGVERVFLLTAPDHRQVPLQTHAIEAAAAAGVQLLVKVSATRADPTSSNVLLREHGEIEARALDAGLPSVFLRPTFFMQNLLMLAGGVAAEGRLYTPPAGRIPQVHAADVAAVAARVLREDGHAGHAYELTGGVAYDYPEVAAQLGRAFGRAVTHVELPADVVREAMVGQGVPGWLVDSLLDLYARGLRGEATAPTPHVAELTGRPPRTLAEFAREHAAAFAPPVPGVTSAPQPTG
ncbi:MAG: NmrA family NAD(P)-binding protein [Gemmatirosa sp.]